MESKLSGHSHDTAIVRVNGPNSRCLKDAELEQALRLLSCRCKSSYDHHPERNYQQIINELYKHLVAPLCLGGPSATDSVKAFNRHVLTITHSTSRPLENVRGYTQVGKLGWLHCCQDVPFSSAAIVQYFVAASTLQCPFQETAQQTDEQEQVQRLGRVHQRKRRYMHSVLLASSHAPISINDTVLLHVSSLFSQLSLNSTLDVAICSGMWIFAHRPVFHTHYTIRSNAGHKSHNHYLRPRLPASDRFIMGSSGSHEDPSRMCDDHGQTWRGRGKQAVRSQSTGQHVVTDS